MRSGRGKCPQCREMIVVDLDAPELRCPYCGALLRQSAKKPEVKNDAAKRIEEENRRAAAAAVEAVPEVPETPVLPAEEKAPETIPEPIPEQATEVVPETIAEAAPESATDIPSDEISEDELAMMDEAPVTEESSAEESVPVEDEIGLTDEELAMMDEAPIATEEDAGPAATENEEPQIYGSIGATEEDLAPEEEQEPEAEEETPAEEPPVNNNIELSDEELVAPDADLLDDGITPSEVVEPMQEEAPVEEKAETPVSEEIVIEDAPTVVPAEESAPEAAAEIAPEPEVIAPMPEPAPAAEPAYVPTAEDMAFAASLSETVRGYVPTRTQADRTAKSAERGYKKAASEMSMGGAIYKKAVAVIMMILSILAAAVWIFYYRTAIFGLVSADLVAKLGEVLPTFGETAFPLYVVILFAGLIALITILGMTGRKGKLAFLFLLLADLAFAVFALFGGKGFGVIAEIEVLTNAVAQYGDYFLYGVYTLILAAAVCFAVSLSTHRESFGFSRTMSILPSLYLALVTLAYAALILLPLFIEGFSLDTEIINYAILGVIGAALLLTFVGVHNPAASRSANGWLFFATLALIVLVNVIPVVLFKVAFAKELLIDVHAWIPLYLTPIIAIFGVAGFAASDLRN